APSELWGRFPSQAMFAMAGKIDAPEFTNLLGDFVPANAQQALTEAVNRGAGAALGLDVIHDVLPNIGPDWGFSISAPPSSEKTLVPVMIGALRVRSGGPTKRVDQALLSGLNALAFGLIFNYNQSHTDAIKLSSVLQDRVEVKYLSNDKLFPAGV